MNKYKVILLFILLLASFLRFYKLTEIPPSLEWDEVATGYDANSILKTGKDQYGNFLPLTFRSLDDYKPPLYTYLTAGSIAVWGWNDFAVRFPAALLGVLAVVTTYGMVNALLGNKKLALTTALLLAISPWHVNFSRLALETNSTIFFTTAAVWAFLAGLKNGWGLALSALLFGLDMFLYHNARVFVPIFGVALIVLYFKELTKQKIYLGVAAVITLLFVIRLLPVVTSIEGKMRFEGTSIFSPATPIDIAEKKDFYVEARVRDAQDGIGIFGTMFHNQYVMWGLMLFKNYLSHFDPLFLVFTSDYPRHHVPEMGLIYFVELPFLLVGLYFLLRQTNWRGIGVAFFWLLVAPIPAAVTRDVPHALRVEIMLPIIQLLIGLGLIGTLRFLSTKKIVKMVFLTVLIVGFALNISFFLHKFYYHYARETSEYWQFGRKEAAQYVDSIKHNYAAVLVSTRLEQPHMFFLYYLKYDPAVYQKEGGTFSGGWAETRNRFDTYQFIPLKYEELRNEKTLFVGLPDEFPSDANILHKVYYLNGKEAIWIVAG